MRIVLFGSEGGFSRPVLEQLFARDLCVIAVVMQVPLADNSDFPVGIKQAIKPGSLEQLAIKNKLSVLKTHSLSDDEFIQQLTEKRADLLLVACFAQKIPLGIWQNMNLPCWNLHPSLLPKYRGPSPLHWQIKNNETYTGLTLHEVTRQLDAGDIVARQSLPLPAKHDNRSLNIWVSEHGVELFYQALICLVNGKLEPQAQDETIASYYPYAC